MRNLVFILSALLCIELLAEERKIEIEKKTDEKIPERSTTCSNLSVVNEGNIITFTSESIIEVLYFEVKTLTGETVTSETISLVAGQTYTTTIGEVESDVYILEIKINGETYCGYLEIY